MSDKLIIKCFTETNNWEGETWNFLISMTEEQYLELEKLLEDSKNDYEEVGEDFPYSIKKKEYTLEQAKILDEEHNDDHGYLPKYQYCGRLNKKLRNIDNLYKGGIKDFCILEK